VGLISRLVCQDDEDGQRDHRADHAEKQGGSSQGFCNPVLKGEHGHDRPYFVGGLGMTALTMNDIVVVPIRTGVGIRLGANIGYLKFTPTATWNPF
jgi:hypothetical protein